MLSCRSAPVDSIERDVTSWIQRMSRLIDTWRMDRSAWTVETLADQDKDRAYWLTRDPAERLAAIELTRQIHYGYDPSTARLQRVYTIVELGRS